MVDVNATYDEEQVDTDIFVIVENKNDDYDFVTIDEDPSYDAVVIDMSQHEFTGVITIDFNEDAQQDSFVSIDEDQVIISDFKVDDLFFGFDFK